MLKQEFPEHSAHLNAEHHHCLPKFFINPPPGADRFRPSGLHVTAEIQVASDPEHMWINLDRTYQAIEASSAGGLT